MKLEKTDKGFRITGGCKFSKGSEDLIELTEIAREHIRSKFRSEGGKTINPKAKEIKKPEIAEEPEELKEVKIPDKNSLKKEIKEWIEERLPEDEELKSGLTKDKLLELVKELV